MYTPVNPSFNIYMRGLRGQNYIRFKGVKITSVYRNVSMMFYKFEGGIQSFQDRCWHFNTFPCMDGDDRDQLYIFTT